MHSPLPLQTPDSHGFTSVQIKPLRRLQLLPCFIPWEFIKGLPQCAMYCWKRLGYGSLHKTSLDLFFFTTSIFICPYKSQSYILILLFTVWLRDGYNKLYIDISCFVKNHQLKMMPRNRKVFESGIPSNKAEEEVASLFAKIGSFNKVSIGVKFIRNKKYNYCFNGHCTESYEDLDDANKAVQTFNG